MKTKILLCTAAIVAAMLGSVGSASAQTGPDTKLCTDAKVALQVQVAAVLNLNPNVFPNNVLPAAGAVTAPLLNTVLADPDLGGGGQTVVKAAIAALAKVDEACKAPVVTTTVTPPPVTTTVTPPPTLTPGDIDCDDVSFAEAQRILKADPKDPNGLDFDRNGIACDAPSHVPGGTGSVETGGGPA
jgi:hypothetical protein